MKKNAENIVQIYSSGQYFWTRVLCATVKSFLIVRNRSLVKCASLFSTLQSAKVLVPLYLSVPTKGVDRFRLTHWLPENLF